MKEFFALQQTLEFKREGETLIPQFKDPNRLVLNEGEIEGLGVVNRYAKSVKDYLENPPHKYSKIIGVDIETTGLDFTSDTIRLIAVYSNDFNYVGIDIEKVSHLLSDSHVLKVFHNAPFDVSFLRHRGIVVENFTDTMIMHQIIKNKPNFYSLRNLSEIYLGKILDKSLQHADNWHGVLTHEQYQYCLEDAKTTYQLYNCMMPLIIDRYLYPRYRREISALPAIIDLTVNGMKLNWEAWSCYLEQLKLQYDELDGVLKKNLGCTNLGSYVQVKQALEHKGIFINNTTEEELKRMSYHHPIVADLLQYKKMKKLLTTYNERLREKLNSDGKLRGKWHLIGAKTSRMSCQSPNFQSIPKEMRSYFNARKGHTFIIMDYSTIELRILAEITGCQSLIDAFNNKADLHVETAKIVLGSEFIGDDERQLGKVINFGLVYGLTPYGLKEKINAIPGFNINEYEAKKFINQFFKTYPEVLSYQQSCIHADIISTLGGNYWDEFNGLNDLNERQRFNYAIQGSCAEGLKNALALLHRSMDKNWSLINVVHDEFILEVPETDADRAVQCLKCAMVEGMGMLVRKVPIEVSVNQSKTWIK